MVTNTLNRVAISIYILQKVAAQLRDPKFAALVAEWDNSVTECVQGLIKEKGGEAKEKGGETQEKGGEAKEKEDDPRHFLLHQVYPSQQLVQVLRSSETLEKLGLAKYFVAENILFKGSFLNKKRWS